ncbi:MAG: phosphoribosyl-AMP cyclohydrolase [Limnochordia bacterium]|jgi:phosphoribosyl-ATP pyrophosphohydrolase/phosphoribosyl-AMP cyclohydrolase
MEVGIDNLKWDAQGLIPAIVQDAVSGRVLMLAYMNREALQRSLESGETWFFSRSRGRLWHKGEQSGHVQKIEQIETDCDRDTLLVRVRQQGAGACHEGYISCFHYVVELEEQAVRIRLDETSPQTFDPGAVYAEQGAQTESPAAESTER